MMSVFLTVTLLWSGLMPGVRTPGRRGRGASGSRRGWLVWLWLVKLIEILNSILLLRNTEYHCMTAPP